MPQPSTSALGRFIREQRQSAQLSLREMARMASISNAYLSQVERGMHVPSVRVLRSLADVLDVPVEDLVNNTPSGHNARSTSVEVAIQNDRDLDQVQKDALLAVYRSYRHGRLGRGGSTTSSAATDDAATADLIPPGQGSH